MTGPQSNPAVPASAGTAGATGRTIITCTACGRTAPLAGYGWCSPCHSRWHRHGRPADGPPPPKKRTPDPTFGEKGRAAQMAKAAARRKAYANLRNSNVGMHVAAHQLGLSIRTAKNYEAALRAGAI